MVRKHPDGTYRLYSKKINHKTGKRRHLGIFPTLEAAQNHEWEIQYFKQLKAFEKAEMKK